MYTIRLGRVIKLFDTFMKIFNMPFILPLIFTFILYYFIIAIYNHIVGKI